MGLYLVTGAAGFIGSAIVRELLSQGKQVRGLDNFATGRRENVEGLAWLDFREVDLRDPEALTAACADVDVIFHQAALPSVPRSVKDPRTSHDANIQGTFNLLEAARATGVRRVVYAASSSAYGNQPGMPRHESMRPEPISPYAVQKLTGELYMQSYARVYGLETVCLRYFNIFGPRQVPDSPYSGVMARFALEMLRGVQPTIFGTGEQGRDFTYIDNAVSANLLAAHAQAENVTGKVFNVACGGRQTLNDTYRLLARELNYPNPPAYGPERAGDVRDSQADIRAAQQAFGYNPPVDFEEGIRRTAAWYRETYSEAATSK